MTHDSRLTTHDAPLRPYRRLPFFHGGAAAMLASAEALLEGVAASGQPAIRWYVVSQRALILGASQRPLAVDLDACRAMDVAVYQRSAGGATVLVDLDMLGLDVVLPPADPLLARDLTASYQPLGETWCAALRSLGIPAATVSVEEARASTRDASDAARLARLACFGGLSPYEVTVDGRKVVGLAQVRRRHGALFQTAVQLHWDAPRVAGLLALPAAERPALVAALEDRVAGLDEVAPRRVLPREIAGAFERALAGHGLAPVDGDWTPAEQAATERLLGARYRALV